MEAQVLLNAPARSIARQRSELAGLVEPHGTGSGCNHDAEERPSMIEELQLPWLGGRWLGVPSDCTLELPGARSRTAGARFRAFGNFACLRFGLGLWCGC